MTALERLGAVVLGLALSMCNPGSAAAPTPPAVTVSIPKLAPPTSDSTAEAPPKGPATSDPTAEAAPPEAAPEADVSRVCPRLPPSRPADLVFRSQRTVVPHGGPLRHEGIEIHGARTPCPVTTGPRADPPLPCRQVAAATLDAVFREFKKRGFDTMRAVARSRSPHWGSRTLEVVWGTHVCAMHDSAISGPTEPAEAHFSALMDAVVGAKP